jgi:hypothetical protein
VALGLPAGTAFNSNFTRWSQDWNRSVSRRRDAAVMIDTDDRQASYEVLLLLADADARWWDYGSAVRLLDHAAEAGGGLPPEYEFKRARWARLRDLRGSRPQAWSRQAA